MDITSAINGGMTINQVRRGTDLAAVTAQVLARYASNDSPRSIPAGPLDDLYPEQRMVLVCEDVNARTKEKLFVFLYGIWAEKFQFIKVTNCIQVWGGENIVFDYEPEAPKVLSCCICISDRIERDDKGVEIDTIDTKLAVFYGVDHKDYFSLTSATIEGAEAPQVHLMNISGFKRRRAEASSGPTVVGYQYKSLQEVIESPDNDKVNLYGVVAGYQHAKLCNGSHKFVSTFSLIDPSNKFHTTPVVVNMFCHAEDRFPDIAKIGDVVRFHRAKKNKVHDKTVLTTYGDGAENSYIVFRRAVDFKSGFPVVHSSSGAHVGFPVPDIDLSPPSPVRDRYGRINIMMSDGRRIPLPHLHEAEWSYQSNSQHVTFSPSDADIVKNLYYWGMQSFYGYSLHDSHTPLTSLCGVLNNDTGVNMTKCDMVCLILSNPTRHLDGSYSLKVWDASLAKGETTRPVGPGTHVLLDELEQEMGNVFAHCMGWPVELLTELQTGSFCPGSCEGDMTANGDVAALNEWYLPRLEDFKKDSVLLSMLKDDILYNYATVIIENARPQDMFIRKYCKPGSWVRLRELEIEYNGSDDARNADKVLKITRRTHVNKILPYFRDVINTFERLLVEKCKSSTGNVADVGASSSNAHSSANQPKTKVTVINRPMMSSTGEPLTNLALCSCATPPAVFCCICRIVDWFPRDISMFVSDEPSNVLSSKTAKHFLFSVRIADDSAIKDIILFKEDALFFLNGITVEQIRRNTNGSRKRIENRLAEVVETRTIFEFHLRLYTTLDKRNVPIKRLAAFKTCLF